MPADLVLPKRYESLEDAATEQQADLTRIVRKVPTATARVEQLLRRVTSSRIGAFEVFLGPSGSGKTTFLSTLPRFYSGAHLTPISDTLSLAEVLEEVRQKGSSPIDGQIFVMLERDNPNLDVQELRQFFEGLRRLFRKQEGRVLLLWPITDEKAARQISDMAWAVGSDSLVDQSTKGIYQFTGLSKDDYYDVADITTRSLNSGLSLEAFGLGESVTEELLQRCATISQFFGLLEAKSQELNRKFGDTLKERKTPQVWVLVGGDDTRELSLTVASLTAGVHKRVDGDRMLALLDAEDSTGGYLGAWRKRRNELAFILRHLDVRVFELTPNVVVAAMRAFGDDNIKSRLSNKRATPASASAAMKGARFFQEIAGQPASVRATIRQAEEKTSNEYLRIQQLASKGDKGLNKAIAACLKRALHDTGISADVTAEQRALDPKSSLQPDIMVELLDGRLICIEPTWRTTGRGIPNELKEQQSTMTVGHIQQYLLSKILEYVNDLGL